MHPRQICVTLTLLLLTSSPKPAFAEYTQAIQELFQSDTVYPQGQGEIQFTLLPSYAKGDGFSQQAVPVILEYGITNRFQIQAEWLGYARHSFSDPSTPSVSGIGDLELGFRYSWMEIAQSYFHAAFGVDFNLPIGDESKGLSEGHFGATPAVVIAADMDRTKGTQFMAQFGADIEEGHVSTKDAEWFMNFAILVPFQRTTLTAEWNVTEEQQFLTPGLIWQPKKNLEIGIGAPIGLNDDADDYRIVFMLTLEFDTD